MYIKHFLFLILGTTIWGLSPIFYRLLYEVSAIEIVAHRSIWSTLFLFIYLIIFSKVNFSFFKYNTRELFLLTTSGLMIAINWYGFIYAINSGNALQASLGYYIFPLVAVVLAFIFNNQKFNKMQLFAILIASIGVATITLQVGKVPVLSLILAFSFGFYGLIKGKVRLDPISSVAFETLLIAPFAALFFIFFLGSKPLIAIENGITTSHFLLIFSGLITAIPLVLFSAGAKFFSYATVGLVQYVNPSLQFLIALFYFKESFEIGHFISFLLIWVALGFYTFDSICREVSKSEKSSST